MSKKPFDINSIQKDFPNLDVKIRGKRLAYLDSAASTFKLQSVIDKIHSHYSSGVSNVHRGLHYLSEQTTFEYEESRKKIQKFINASSEREIIFTRGTTEGINLVAQTYGRKFLKEGDEIIISAMEHHSNIVPWQMLCEEKGCVLKVIPMNYDGEILMDAFESLVSEKTKFISLVHVSNSLGTINPIESVIAKAKEHAIPVLVDAAQSISHFEMDVQSLDCDFLVFSGHKLFGPTGTGVLYGKEKWLEQMPPYQGGGDMIEHVSFEKTTYNSLPYKFEAGTPHIAGFIGLGEAIDYLSQFEMKEIQNHKNKLLTYGTKVLSAIDGIKFIGTAQNKTSVISFLLDGIHAQDLGTILDQEGVAIRTGHHCTEPVMDFYGITSTSRASFSIYNTTEDFDQLATAIQTAKSLF